MKSVLEIRAAEDIFLGEGFDSKTSLSRRLIKRLVPSTRVIVGKCNYGFKYSAEIDRGREER